MKKINIKSDFKNLNIEVFYYESKNKTNKIIFLFKGLYGFHDPTKDKWDNQIIEKHNNDYSFVCINTSRIDGKKGKEAFFEKKFQDEVNDINNAFEFLEKEKIINQETEISIIAHSFGGTVTLALEDILKKVKILVLSGSGCGKSKTTTKPLLSTLPNEDELLKNIRKYKNKFVFIMGENDEIVPKESQYKIIESVVFASDKKVNIIKNADHNLLIEDNKITKGDILWNGFWNAI